MCCVNQLFLHALCCSTDNLWYFENQYVLSKHKDGAAISKVNVRTTLLC